MSFVNRKLLYNNKITQAYSLSAYQDLCYWVLNKVKGKGATQAEVSLILSIGFSVDVRLGKTQTIEHHQDKGLSLSVYIGKKKGSVSCNDLSYEALNLVTDKAITIANVSEEDICNGLAPEELMNRAPIDLDLYHPCDIDIEQSLLHVKNCEQVAFDYNACIQNSDGASFNKIESFNIYANTHGMMGAFPSSSYSMSCVVIGKDKDDMQRDYEYSISRVYSDLVSPEVLGQQAAKRVVARMGSQKIKTQKSLVLFDAKVAKSLMRHLVSGLSGSALYRKSSFLLNSLGKQIFPEFIEIGERPHLIKEQGSCAFDSEGVATKTQIFIKQGYVYKYILDSYAARRLDMQTTANAGGVYNLYIKAYKSLTKSQTEMIKSMNTGLFVTELMGHGINIVTGDYSRGAAGFWVKNGEIQYPVHEITIASNLKEMFKNIILIGNDIDKRSNFHVGSILINNMTIAGQ